MRRVRDLRVMLKFASGIHYPYYPDTLGSALERFRGIHLGPKDEVLLQRHDPTKGWETTQRRVG